MAFIICQRKLYIFFYFINEAHSQIISVEFLLRKIVESQLKFLMTKPEKKYYKFDFSILFFLRFVKDLLLQSLIGHSIAPCTLMSV